MRIMHNIPAINAYRSYNVNASGLAKNLEKLSSGFRINRAADDAAGLAISEKMRAQITGLDQGMDNIQDGVSLCYVADGALNEVSSMLRRIKELAVQSANGVYGDEIERPALQAEVREILSEIERISEHTNFNGIPLFQGYDTVVSGTDGNPIIAGDIPFADFSLHDTTLGYDPFRDAYSADALALQAIVTNTSSSAYGECFNLIYGSGSTSNSSLKLTYTADDGSVNSAVIADFDSLDYVGSSGDITSSANPLQRTFSYTGSDNVQLRITQKVYVSESANEKNYNISYQVENTGSRDVDVQFMFHADTAYNNDDYCESYFINGNKVSQTGIYKGAGGVIGSSSQSAPTSFSIINQDAALAFSEKITFGGGSSQPDLSIGHWDSLPHWDYAQSPTLSSTDNMDLGFSLLWDFGTMGAGDTNSNASFKYGIVATEHDANLQNVVLNKDNTARVERQSTSPIWIQASGKSGDGLYVKIDEMNCNVLGISGVDISTITGANRAVDTVDGAIDNISANRAVIGASQNRLEHTLNNVMSTHENLQASESRIRDTNMAEEMMLYTKNNILAQAAQAMLAQANSTPQYVLQLLQ